MSMSSVPPPPTHYFESTLDEPLYSWTDWEAPLPVISATPVPCFELSSLKLVLPLGFDRDSIEVAGQIVLINDKGIKFPLFSQHPDRPVVLPLRRESNGRMHATLSNFRCVSTSDSNTSFYVLFHLVDASTPRRTLLHQYKFFSPIPGSYNQQFMALIPSPLENALGQANYTFFEFPITAQVSFIVEKIGDSNNGDSLVEVAGDMFATYGILGNEVVRPLYLTRGYRHGCGNLINVNKFGVPVYSSLSIKANLVVNGVDELRGDFVFHPFPSGTVPYEKHMETPNFRIRVLVFWFLLADEGTPSYDQLRGRRVSKRNEIVDELSNQGQYTFSSSDRNLISKCQQTLGRMKHNHLPFPFTLPVTSSSQKLPYCYKDYVYKLMEVYSVLYYSYSSGKTKEVDMISGRELNRVSGNIQCVDFLGEKRPIFVKGDEEPYLLDPSGTLPLESRGCCFYGDYLKIRVKLKDDTKGGHCIEENVTYNYANIDRWMTQRICSIFKGKNSFAVVNYCVFEHAVPSTVELTLNSEKYNFYDDTNFQVFGKITARLENFKNFTYSSLHEKNNWQSVLFHQHETHPLKIINGGKIPLCKSVICVPVNDSLNASFIVMCNITILMNGGKSSETIKYAFEATLDLMKHIHKPSIQAAEIVSTKVQGSEFGLSICVDWGRKAGLFEEGLVEKEHSGW